MVWILVKQYRSKISTVILTLLTIGICLFAVAGSKAREKATPTVQADQSEIALRLTSALEQVGHEMSSKLGDTKGQIRNQVPDKVMRDFMKETEDALDSSFKDDPTNLTVAVKRVILLHKMGESIRVPLVELEHTNAKDGPLLAKTLSHMYSEKPSVDMETAGAVEKALYTAVPEGWYRDTVLRDFFKAAGAKKQLEFVERQQTDQSMALFYKFGCIVVLVLFLGFAGIIVDIVQLILLGRRVTPKEEEELIKAPANYGFKAVYGVFVFWFASIVVFSSLAAQSIRPIIMANKGVMASALATVALYLFQFALGAVYAYFFAMRPHAVKLLEGVKLRFHVGKYGPGRLILAGFLAWIGAMPIVLVCGLVSMKFFHSHGSSNPIIALIMEAVRSSNFAAIMIFYLTVGVLAPLCEESVFRGFLYSALRRKFSVLPSMAISAAVFSAAHQDPGAFLPLFALGMIFAFLLEKTKSTIPGMIAHGLWNSGSFTLVLLLFGN